MILEALHTTINPILQAFVLLGDFETTVPFCVYKATPVPIRIKAGISGYEQTVNIGIVGTTPEQVNQYTETVTTAVNNMAGQTINNTEIEHIVEQPESGIYDTVVDGQVVYMNDLEFKIFTKNR